MPAWLGIALCVMFASVGVLRARQRDACGMLMAAGMAVMALGMGGIGPHLVHGPWWAAAFAGIALWPTLCLLRPGADRPRRSALLHGHVPHLVGGVAMVYMCVAGLAFAPAPPDDPAAVNYQLAAVQEHHHSGGLVAAGVIGGPESASVGLFALLGWLLAGYFLFSAVCGLTRRGADARPTCSRRAVTEAAMGAGTIVMLVSMI
jgi:hypothetical protein